jgi:hypothetical protein
MNSVHDERQRALARARVSELLRSASAEEICDFSSWSVNELAKLFDATAARWGMPATVVADEFFTCLLCIMHTREVPADSLENLPLAQALRAHHKEMKRHEIHEEA